VASGFRSYHRQKTIFDEKWQGKRAVLSDDDSLLDRSGFKDSEWLDRILRFSALPGTSRHHWGTDIDVFDRAALSTGQQPALLPSEYHATGVFARLGEWLQEHMAQDNAEGFFRPYDVDTGGVSVEPWHLSFRPMAERFAEQMSAKALRELWIANPALQPEAYALLLEKLDQLFDRYVN
jgi:LAS superfamily LD-carboxypeptidase LdcB